MRLSILFFKGLEVDVVEVEVLAAEEFNPPDVGVGICVVDCCPIDNDLLGEVWVRACKLCC